MGLHHLITCVAVAGPGEMVSTRFIVLFIAKRPFTNPGVRMFYFSQPKYFEKCIRSKSNIFLCENDLSGELSKHIYAPDLGPNLPS